ncbi:PilN domain-containing protein [Phytohalomonas tamaricis]|uniref:PilN domain-containing protein n=1 Tax=Phytohalomonas tamaricis TaxID=2081032 RepID=UPI0021D4564B|nr:PilN domain-containing protein [Phytohalomonas tamaricis]
MTAPMKGIEINLLPWREQARERRTRQFYGVIACCVLLAVAFGWLKAQWVQGQLDAEQERIEHIEQRIVALEHDIQVVKDLQVRREQLQKQIDLIRQLQFSRPQTVELFDQLTATLVDGTYYDRVVRHDAQLDISGVSRTNRQVSDQMRALAMSRVFGEPLLLDVKSSEGGDSVRRFNLTVPEQVASVEGADNASAQEAGQ